MILGVDHLVRVFLCVQDLSDDIKSELSGDFEKVMLGLLMTPAQYDAFECKAAIKVGGYRYCSDSVGVSCQDHTYTHLSIGFM